MTHRTRGNDKGGMDRSAVGAQPSSAPTYYRRDPIVIAGWRNLGVVVWGAQATLEAVRTMGVMSADLLKSHTKISVVQIICNNAPVPTDEAHRALLKLTELGTPYVGGLVFVIAGEGFWASTMRSFLTHVHWVRQRPFDRRIFSTIEEVAAWMPSVHSQQTGVAFSSEELLDLLTACVNCSKCGV